MSEHSLAQLGVVLQTLQQKYDLPKNIKQFVLVGDQSAGKSRFLSVFAGTKLGFEKSGKGTLCPVSYSFNASIFKLDSFFF